MQKRKQKELWAPVKGFPLYECSQLGNVRNVNTKQVLRPQEVTKNHYFQYNLYNKGKNKFLYAHRIVALAWCLNPYNLPEVDHINGIKSDNRAINLCWITHRDNCRKAVAMRCWINLPKGSR